MNIIRCLNENEYSNNASSEVEKSQEKKELRPRNNLGPGVFQEYKRTYVKVPSNAKEQLAQLVFMEGFKIKDAAKKLGIKYATAKTIIFHMRKENVKKMKIKSKNCKYTSISENRILKYKIISTLSSRVVSSKEFKVFFQQNDQYQGLKTV
ncbi:unnamed protein product (macronuclear) [Paramecium tetraurelia]|uniref:HTH psq-type domain-containing protein n=1 Tax=Paramecium tetraurelia TaxID=5888 RepID=A0BZ15_PARTE|nr:uncharacterized protein GSPATT00033635001 [Paramecium tetraurelia]CAK63782.1 unnamed protein product [Paramecium tetraurelia]|eukprot:XP_001431180.1 hypothetical protein (macronuclear) [Paramecium tetraurelia strain d4-2]